MSKNIKLYECIYTFFLPEGALT